MERPLIDEEHELLALLAQAYNLFASKVCASERTRAGDLREFAAHIHALQNVVLANAAARFYPDRYRLAGGEVGK